MIVLTVALVFALIALAVVSTKAAKQSVLPNGFFVVYDVNADEIATLTPKSTGGEIEYEGFADRLGLIHMIKPVFVGFTAQEARCGFPGDGYPFTADALCVTEGQIIRMHNVTLEAFKRPS